MTGECQLKVTLSTKGEDASWSSVTETYRYATVYVRSKRRYWWQFWHSKSDRVVWSGPIVDAANNR